MAKFKVGDRVVVKDSYYDVTFRGLVGTVKSVQSSVFCEDGDLISVEFDEPISGGWGCYGKTKNGHGLRIREKFLELKKDKPEKIIIRREGDSVIAHCIHTKVGAVAKCSPEDEFDFAVGAKLAFERLSKILGWVEEPKPPLYNGKVVCIDNDLNKDLYTIGKIYEFKDGLLRNDMGNLAPKNKPCTTFNEWSDFTASDFIEVVE